MAVYTLRNQSSRDRLKSITFRLDNNSVVDLAIDSAYDLTTAEADRLRSFLQLDVGGTVGTPTPSAASIEGRISLLESAGRGAPRYRRMVTFGHSWGAGAQLSNASRRWVSVLAARYGCEDVNAAVSGSVFSAGDTVALPGIGAKPGGHQTLNRILKPARGLPFADLNLLVYPYNDIGLREPTTPTLLALRHTYRFAIASCRAGVMFEDSDARWAYSAGWTANVVTDGTSSGAANHSATAQNEVATLSLTAADFNGAVKGDVCIVLQASGAGATVAVLVDGVQDGTLNLNELTNGDAISNSTVYRLKDVSAGTRSIQVKVTSSNASTAFIDKALITAATPPVVALTTHYLPVATRVYTSAIHTPVTQSDVAAMNSVIRDAVAEWDSRVVVIPFDTALSAAAGHFADDAATGFTHDDLHPNPAGHEAMAAVAANVLDGLTIAPCYEPQVPKPFIIGDRNMPAFSASWSNTLTANYPTLRFYKIGTRVRLVGNIKKSSAGAAGEVIITLPIGFRPSVVQAFTNLATANVLGWGRVDVDGTLRCSGGDPTGFWTVDAIFDADGA